MIRIPIARRSWPYLLICFCITALAWWVHWIPGVFMLFLTILMVNFFRDPERKIPNPPPETLLAPADGKVISIEPSPHPDFSGHIRISIFMNIFDVHVNRVPINGKLKAMYHHPGLFLKANDPRAPGENERMEFTLLTTHGPIMVCLVAGLIARRIISWARPDDPLLRGQRFTMIKLGSRVDIHVPIHTQILVQPGCRVKAGLSVVGRLDERDCQ